MAKKRTRKQKEMAVNRHVNTQFVYSFKGVSNTKSKSKNASITENSNSLASIKKDLIKSLVIAVLILISLAMVYLLS